MTVIPRCPVCGYTREDALFHGGRDHLCTGKIPLATDAKPDLIAEFELWLDISKGFAFSAVRVEAVRRLVARVRELEAERGGLWAVLTSAKDRLRKFDVTSGARTNELERFLDGVESMLAATTPEESKR